MADMIEKKMDSMKRLSQGNPGAIAFFTSMEEEFQGDPKWDNEYYESLARLVHLNIRGSDAYKFWNDVCGKNNKKAANLLRKAYFDRSFEAELQENMMQTRADPMEESGPWVIW